MNDTAAEHINGLINRIPSLADIRGEIEKTVKAVCDCHERGGKVLVCGNGGSASDSEHIVGELMKGFVLPRKLPAADVEKLKRVGAAELAENLQQGIKAVSLIGHPALSTAVLNDNDPYMAFAQQVYVLGEPGDVFIGLSTSGNARNVVNAAKVAKALGLAVVGFTGSRPSKLEDVCDITIKAPIAETFMVQEYHLPVYHTICLAIEAQIFGE